MNTNFDEFSAHISSDSRSTSLDHGNIKLTYGSVRREGERGGEGEGEGKGERKEEIIECTGIGTERESD